MIIENSFTVFSIDFLITIFSIFIIEKKFRENFKLIILFENIITL